MDIPFEAYEGSEPYMFVSYAHKDSRVIYAEIKRLYDMGYRIWYDEGIPPTTEWPAEIQSAIDNCAFFLVFISPNAVESQNVRNEINYTIIKKKPILAIFIKAAELKYGLGIQIGSRQAIIKYQMSETRYLQKLTRVLPASLKSEPKVSKILAELVPQPVTDASSPIETEPVVSTTQRADTQVITDSTVILSQEESDILLEIGKKLNKSIPQVSIPNFEWNIFGFSVVANQVTHLSLYDQRLMSLPEEIFQLSQLEQLSLGSNRFTSLPDSFDRLTNLIWLVLDYNKLNSLPKSFFRLTNLQALSLGGNQFTILPESFGNFTQLEILSLRKNQLKSLPESFEKLTNLNYLDLSENQFSSLPESFCNLEQLADLNLESNQLRSLPESFGQLQNLRILRLGGNPFPQDEREKVMRLISQDCAIHWEFKTSYY
ncbi:MAG: leucine-rich repeat domain-containing protein [Candidatus Hermodarchaeota archaeon]